MHDHTKMISELISSVDVILKEHIPHFQRNPEKQPMESTYEEGDTSNKKQFRTEYSLVNRLTKLDFPVFDGHDFKDWQLLNLVQEILPLKSQTFIPMFSINYSKGSTSLLVQLKTPILVFIYLLNQFLERSMMKRGKKNRCYYCNESHFRGHKWNGNKVSCQDRFGL